MDADFEATQRAELHGAGDPDHGGAVRVRRDFGDGPAYRMRKGRASRCCDCGWGTGLFRNVRSPRRLQLSAAYRIRLADNGLPALLFTAGGPRSPCGAVIAGRHRTTV